MGLSDIALGSIVVVVAWYLLGIYILYELSQFWMARKERIINSRRPILTIIFVLIVVFRMAISVPASLAVLCEWKVFSSWYSNTIQYFIADLLGIIMACIFVQRLWLLFYDFKYTQANLNALWKKKIDPHATHSTFWINKRNSFGSMKITSIILITFAFLCLFVLYVIPLIFNENIEFHNLLILSLWIPLILFCIVLAALIAPVQDAHFIRDELFRSIAIMILVATGIFALFLSFNDHNKIWFNWLWYVIVNTGLAIVCYIMTRWVMNQHYRINKKAGKLAKEHSQYLKIRKQQQSSNLKKHEITNSDHSHSNYSHSSDHSSIIDRVRAGSHESSNQITARLGLRTILRTKEGFESFVHFLEKEFNVEHMLFLVEVTQFKAILKQKMEALAEKRKSMNRAIEQIEAEQILQQTSRRHRPGTRQRIRTATVLDEEFVLEKEWLPSSHDASNQDPLTHALYIHNKYTHPHSKYSINISSDNRLQLISYFLSKQEEGNNPNPDALYSLYYIFDACWTEVWELLETDSFKRFVRTAECAKLYDVLERRGVLDEEMDQIEEARQSRSQRRLPVDDIEIQYRRKRVHGSDIPDIVNKNLSTEHGNDQHHRQTSSSKSNDISISNEINNHIPDTKVSNNNRTILGRFSTKHLDPSNTNDNLTQNKPVDIELQPQNNINSQNNQNGHNNALTSKITETSQTTTKAVVSSPASKLYERGKLRRPRPIPKPITNNSNDDVNGGDKVEVVIKKDVVSSQVIVPDQQDSNANTE